MRPLACLVFLALPACSSALADGDGRAFGDDLGRFQVTALLDESTCGPGAVGWDERVEFDIVLSEEEPTFYWNTGAAAVAGTLEPNGAFSAQAEVARPSDQSATPLCTLVRSEKASGLFTDPTRTRIADGRLEYRITGEGECGEMILENGLAALPCSLAYDFTATRISDR
ncbi:MAG: hypothetical protein FJ104_05825 [Deltaproteobacteria bacterium]|nr:hypothetical protein [Deltaproteobacteria bacterium]